MIPGELIESEEHPLAPRLKAAIGCPIDWKNVTGVSSRYWLAKDLRIYWAKIAEQYQADNEMRYYSRIELEEDLSEDTLRAIEANVKVWYARAATHYIKDVEFLQRLRMATWGEYNKHRPPPQSNRQEVIRRTARNEADSLFFDDNAVQRCEGLLWEAIGDDLVNVLTNRPPHLYIEASEALGASGGSPCNVIRLDIDYATALAHGHPRPAPPNQKLLGVSCFDRTFPEDYRGLLSDIDESRIKDYDGLLEFVHSLRKKPMSK